MTKSALAVYDNELGGTFAELCFSKVTMDKNLDPKIEPQLMISIESDSDGDDPRYWFILAGKTPTRFGGVNFHFGKDDALRFRNFVAETFTLEKSHLRKFTMSPVDIMAAARHMLRGDIREAAGKMAFALHSHMLAFISEHYEFQAIVQMRDEENASMYLTITHAEGDRIEFKLECDTSSMPENTIDEYFGLMPAVNAV